MTGDDSENGSGAGDRHGARAAGRLGSVSSDYKVLGHNETANGTTYGVLGRVDSPSGFGLYTPDDAGVEGALATTGAHRVTVDGTRALLLGSQSSGEAGSVVHGYAGNDVLDGAVGATVGGGGSAGTSITNAPNLVYDNYGTIAGGEDNQAGSDDDDPTTAPHATVAGGKSNTAGGERATVGGGSRNAASGTDSTIAGGRSNEATAQLSTIGGGKNNATSGNRSFVGGGTSNSAGGANSTVAGGTENRTDGTHATVGGGRRNRALAKAATIAGGGDFDSKNFVYDNYGTVGGGQGNAAGTNGSSQTSAIAATVAGGEFNTASGERATVGGGGKNAASGQASTVAGGRKNDAPATRATVGGGTENTASGTAATVAGGGDNDAEGDNSTVAGGGGNLASGKFATVGGGEKNRALAKGATVAGGGDFDQKNVVYDEYGTVGGGLGNEAGVDDGDATTATGATVAGGVANAATAEAATVPGGKRSNATGKYSLAAGRRAKTNGKNGAFVWGDGTDSSVAAQAAGEVRLQASGGFVLTSTPKVELTSGLPAGPGDDVGINSANELVNKSASSARYKTAIEPLEPDPGAVLDLEPRSFEYERTGEADVGLIAEEVAEAVPELVTRDDQDRPDGVRYDRLGVYLLPELRRNRERIADLEAVNHRLRETIERLRERLAAVEDHLDHAGGRRSHRV